jgi:hypothetical protein
MLVNCPSPLFESAASPFDERAACEKLVRCGVLADEWLTGDDETHYLDYTWCLRRLSLYGRRSDPCADRAYTREQAESAMRCIETTACSALGLPLSQKRGNRSETPEMDRYECPNGEQRRTATVCDQGLLSY